jgi:DNA polymerase V
MNASLLTLKSTRSTKASLDLTPVAPEHREELGRDLRNTVSTWTGVPTCVGIGPTKTLAKLANKIAKTTPQLGGVCDLTSAGARREWLPLMPLEDVWGIGGASQTKLMAMGCRDGRGRGCA